MQKAKPYIAYMNARMVGMMFSGKIAEVMAGPVAEAQDKFLNSAVKEN